MADDKEIVLSFAETNKLRISLGLKPLNDSSSKKVVFVDTSKNAAEETESAEAVRARIEESKQNRKSNEKFAALSETTSAASGSAADWVRESRSKKAQAAKAKPDAESKESKPSSYSSSDLSGLSVSHSAAAFEAGSEVILTMSDTSILETGANGTFTGVTDQEGKLENVNLAESERMTKAKKKKQMLSSMKYSGGYAGWDDDEFEELGGSGVPSSATAQSGILGKYNDGDEKKGHSFVLDSSGTLASSGVDEVSDFDKQISGGLPLSLRTDIGFASDYMTQEEADSMKKKKKKKKTKESTKNKEDVKEGGKKKGKKRSKGKEAEEKEEEEEGAAEPLSKFKKKKRKKIQAPAPSLLSELEATADDIDAPTSKASATVSAEEKAERQSQVMKRKVDKFHQTMQKGNARAKARGQIDDASPMDVDEGADASSSGNPPAVQAEAADPSLAAAMKKAERMKKLKEMRAKKNGTAPPVKTDVVDLIKQSANIPSATAAAQSGMTVDFGTTAEFARKLGTTMESRNASAAAASASAVASASASETEHAASTSSSAAATSQSGSKTLSMQEMEEMARNIQDEDEMEARLEAMEDGEVEDEAATDAANDVASNMLGVTTGNTRGMSGILSMLKATGDLKGKSGGKEELRGRSNDEKTYSDYADQNLDSVVRLDRNKATDKDMLYTKRQVNLEYRDDHGRLLTRKEAFRQLCYQFHGYGSGKKNQEKRLKKIEMENEAREKRVNEDKGTMGSLRKTQEATGKAFVVHRM